MSAQLSMDSGPRFLKFAVLGAIALAFAIGVAMLMRPGEPMQVAAEPNAELGAGAVDPAAIPPPAQQTAPAGDTPASDAPAPAPQQ